MSNNLVNQSTKTISSNELRWIGPVLAVMSSSPMDLFLSLDFCRGCLTCTMYHVKCVYFSGIQGSMICVVDRNQILCDVTFSDHIVHPNCMVHGLQLQYWHSFSIYHISQTIWHRYRWYFLLHILEHFCHCKFQFSFFVYVMIKL